MFPVPRIRTLIAPLYLLSAVAGDAATAQRKPIAAESPAPAPPYGVVADLVLAAPEIADATIRSATRIKGAEAATVPAGQVRFYVEADLLALVRGTGALPPRVGYLLDVPLDARGKPPRLAKSRVLVFARTVPGRAGQLQLVRPDAQRSWTPALDALTRTIVTETVASDAPPRITGIGNAFHVPGALPGEGETQIFLTTATGRPVSISVLRRPGQERSWSVALSEIVDESAKPPARDTLLWYRLACSLPPSLPEGPASDETARDDYRFVIASLGPCTR